MHTSPSTALVRLRDTPDVYIWIGLARHYDSQGDYRKAFRYGLRAVWTEEYKRFPDPRFPQDIFTKPFND